MAMTVPGTLFLPATDLCYLQAMDRIDQHVFLASPQEALERARASGEALDIQKDGRTIARLVPVDSGRRVQPGGSVSILTLANPTITLDDLLTAEDGDLWYAAKSSTSS